ncbi:NAD(P)-binding domain-containing protein [Kitasatospora sp. NBC_01287]|uniref:ketopantoate reductase family protein n=1 Tax=Kitasatospora sp. NBC_01287 TaxID=2903573 RepID=UPI0022547E20|nr:2-dehydropantoate 2-reductase N-terminal domain-containing protein [Kitasatospora sp. NBC_01287]MCX4744313.1 NAD(P)-binding domain-containing protein [Kitasatospora sp. NBC_01287]
MRYIIIGAGAIGGGIGGRLQESGHDVVLVARGPHLAALRADGLRFSTPEGTRTLAVAAVGGPEELDLAPEDVLVVAVKSQHTVGVLQEWAGRPVSGGGTAGEALPVVCAQNGVGNERLALRWFRRVYGMSVWMPATYLEPGRVAVPGAPFSGILHLGRYPRGSDGTVRAIAADLERSRFQAPVDEDVMRWKYGKLIGNLPNALDAVAGPIEGNEPVTELFHRTMAEGAAVLTAAGIAYATVDEQLERRGDLMRTLPLDGVELGGSSSRQSLTRGTGSIESDYLNGEIVLLAREHGVPAPLNEALQRLASGYAREGRAPGGLPAAELAALLALGTEA